MYVQDDKYIQVAGSFLY